MGLKIEGALIICTVAVLGKTSLEKVTPKVERTSYNSVQVKTLGRHISQTIRRIEKHFFDQKLIQCIFIFCENLTFEILIRSNVNGNLKRILWFTVSKALLKSKNIRQEKSLSSIAFWILSIVLIIA